MNYQGLPSAPVPPLRARWSRQRMASGPSSPLFCGCRYRRRAPPSPLRSRRSWCLCVFHATTHRSPSRTDPPSGLLLCCAGAAPLVVRRAVGAKGRASTGVGNLSQANVLPCLDAFAPTGSFRRCPLSLPPRIGVAGDRHLPSHCRARPLGALLHLGMALKDRGPWLCGAGGGGELRRGCRGSRPSPSAPSMDRSGPTDPSTSPMDLRRAPSCQATSPGRGGGGHRALPQPHRERKEREPKCRSNRRADSLRPPQGDSSRSRCSFFPSFPPILPFPHVLFPRLPSQAASP